MTLLNPREYVVNVGPHGTFRKSGNFQSMPKDIDRMFAEFRQKSVKKIALYFHGGLVNERSGLESAARVAEYLQLAGAAPVCFVWETGLVETVSNNISKISQTKLFNKLLKLLIKKTVRTIGFDSPLARGKAGAIITDEQIEAELLKPEPFSEYNRFADVANARTAIGADAINLVVLEKELVPEINNIITKDREFVALINDTKLTTIDTKAQNGSRGIISIANFVGHVVKIIVRIISRFKEKRDHDLYPTIVEEILREFYIAEVGAWVWKLMKDKAGYMWNSNNGRAGTDQYAGRYFLEQLAAYKKEFPETKINLIGHSAGSIAICHLLATTSTLALPFQYENVLFLAPACSVDLFKQEMLSRPDRFKQLRVYTMSDEYECKDMLVPYFYTHSLLYLISGILEDEGESYDSFILGLKRHTGFISPYDIAELKDVHVYFNEQGKDREVLSVTLEHAGDGLRSGAKTHGDFDDDVLTLTSIQYLLQQ